MKCNHVLVDDLLFVYIISDIFFLKDKLTKPNLATFEE